MRTAANSAWSGKGRRRALHAAHLRDYGLEAVEDEVVLRRAERYVRADTTQ